MISRLLAQVNNCSQGVGNANECLVTLPEVDAGKGQLQLVLGIVFGIAGALAIIIIILAAINMATATGDAEKVSRAKKSIIYALIGLIIAVSAEIIVLTLLGRL